jgi:DNA primase
MLRKAIGAIKQAVPVEIYAGELTSLRPSGDSLRGRCPIHRGDNEGALLVDPDERRWHCFVCGEGGDVIDLCQAVEDHAEVWTAMLSLATRYGVDLPPRQRGWHERQPEKNRVREAATRHAARVIQRRLTRVYRPLVIHGGETPGEELEELEALSRSLWPVAVRWAERRVRGA